MKRRRRTPEQVIRKLREADRLLAEGKDVEEVARHLEVSAQTYYRWRNQFGGMKADDPRGVPICSSCGFWSRVWTLVSVAGRRRVGRSWLIGSA